ncbi:hypothetical protein GCM10022222_51670 [Amycolatopsis ultiminotia]|uniref:Uncharacterized protein n=1 Tax=Amycolatopsis ultiminotia TaxID=543629 RepID=A0ABP6X799_9PSEU
MSQQWFDPGELAQMSRPTMDRAIEAIDRGDLEEARALCSEMRHEWRFLHDLMAEQLLGLVTFIQERFGEEYVADAWTLSMERGWRKDVAKIQQADRREIVKSLAATWRAHSTSGVGSHPGAFTITEDEEKFTFTMNPCGSGQRLWRRGRYQGPNAFGVTRQAHDWSYGREGFPLYCTHCTFMNESLPIRWYGAPLYPSDPPDDFDHDPCVWYWYKNPDDIPERHWTRYGADKPDTVTPAHRSTGE